jgi:hypothetical protein
MIILKEIFRDPKTLALIGAFLIHGCESVDQYSASADSQQSFQYLDGRIIKDMKAQLTNSESSYDGVSGRVVVMINQVAEEMIVNHSQRCGADPLKNHLFLFSEGNLDLKIRTIPRFVPADIVNDAQKTSLRDGYRSLKTQDLFPKMPKKARALDGCEIEFVIDLGSMKIIETNISS